jgi:CubicO group peptidase (beta-lactamase class C family)
LREEIAGPMGIDMNVGLPAEDDARVGEFIAYVAPPGEESMRPWLERDPATVSGLDLARILAYRNPPSHPDGGIGTRMWRGAEWPSTNALSNARAVARMFGILANGGAVGSARLLSNELIREAHSIHSDGEDAVLGRPNRFGLGFQLTIPGVRPLGPGVHSFGHYGNGGVLGFADPGEAMGFGYVNNRAGRSWRDPRNIALVDAVYASL